MAGFAAVLVIGFAGAADAQRGKGKKGKGGPPVRVLGQVVSFADGKLTVKSRTGETVTVGLAERARVMALRPAKFSDLKKGDFVASAGVRQRDGTLHALELRIFPDSMRGRGEGHRPFRGGPDHTMTNATIDAVVGSVGDRTIKVAYQGGEKTIVVPKDVKVMYMMPGNPGLLKAGAPVSVVARKRGKSIQAFRVLVGLDGLVPPG